MPWVVGLLGRPSGGEGGKLLGESGHLGIGLGASFIGMGLFSPDLSFFLCERGTLPPTLPASWGEWCRGAVTNGGVGPRHPARQVIHLFTSSFPLRCKTRIVRRAAGKGE